MAPGTWPGVFLSSEINIGFTKGGIACVGKSNAKKKLRRLEKELNQFKEQQTNYDRRIEELKNKKRELQAQVDPLQSEERFSGFSELGGFSEKAEKVRASCLQVKLALEKLSQAGAVLLGETPSLNFATQNNDKNTHAQENRESDLLELLNSPKFRQVANDLLGDLLK